jgi:hypothetical protein
VKTIRFTQVVQRAGRPEVHTLWLPPEKDPELKRAQKTHRVMTLARGGAAKTPVGTVGFDVKHAAAGQLLVFPKSLARFEGARIVGIKFDLIDEPPVVAVGRSARPAPRRQARRKR